MLRLIIPCLLLSACSTAPVAARETEAPRSAVEACLTGAAQDRAARSACIGRVTATCIDSDDANSTTPGMVGCANGERMQWAELRDRYAELLRARESESQRALLEDALAQHASWTRARCAYAASMYEGGTLARFAGAACMRDSDAEFAIELHGRLFDEF